MAWIELRKEYVSFHLMGVNNAKVHQSLSKPLQARLQGKTCFNLRPSDGALIPELEALTARGLAAFRDAGFIVAPESA